MNNRKASKLLAAAVLTIGGLAFVGCNRDDTASNTPPPAPAANSTPGQKVGNAIDNTTRAVEHATTEAAGAVSPTGATSLEGARNAVEGVTEDALSRNDFKKVAGYFTDADDDRVVKTKPDTKDLDDQIEAFDTAWKTKYKYSFKIKDVVVQYPDTFVHFEKDSADPKKATGIIASSHGAPEVTIPFVEQAGLWKIDIPDTIDGKMLHDNLLAALTTLNQNATSWSDNDTDAAQAVTHAIMAAVMNQK